MKTKIADAVICGAGICGISAAYHLAIQGDLKKIILVDKRAPMSFTSDKSSECYRNWWPGPGDTMVRFMNHSIDLLEALAVESRNRFGMNRRGYVFLTGDPDTAERFRGQATAISALGAGPLRTHGMGHTADDYQPSDAAGWQGGLEGADLVLDPATIRRYYPFITQEAIALLHTRRCGWLDAQQLGAYLLERARPLGVQFLRGEVTGVHLAGGVVKAVQIDRPDAHVRIDTPVFINAGGPFVEKVSALMGVPLPVFNELHAKVSLRDPLGIIPPEAPLMIWEDPVHLFWSEEEKGDLMAFEEGRRLLERYPGGVHFRPEGGPGNASLLGIWTYDTNRQQPVENPVFNPDDGEILLRGLVNMIPGLAVYLDKLEKPNIDGGYYCKTRENRPLIGPLGVGGAYIFGAVSGFGIMAGMGGGDLLARHVLGSTLPDYAPEFYLSRYSDPDYQAKLEALTATSGQL